MPETLNAQFPVPVSHLVLSKVFIQRKKKRFFLTALLLAASSFD